MTTNQSKSRYKLHCEPCGYKSVVEQTEAYKEIPQADIQKTLPKLNPKTGKTIPAEFVPQAKMLRCPSCGRGVVCQPLSPTFIKAEKQQEQIVFNVEEQERLKKQQERYEQETERLKVLIDEDNPK